MQIPNKFNYFNFLNLKYIIRRNTSRNKWRRAGNVTKERFISTVYERQSEINWEKRKPVENSMEEYELIIHRRKPNS